MESSDTHVVLHFGYIARNGDVLGYYSTALPKSFLDANREDWLEYMGKVGDVPDRAMDVLRHLAHEPVSAGPPSARFPLIARKPPSAR